MSTAARPLRSADALVSATIVPLHGSWRRSIGGRTIDTVAVPGTYPPVGECTLDYQFDTPSALRNRPRHFLVTEGVLAWASFTLNGTNLGTAGPWSRYRFELPAGLLQESNQISAVIKDITTAFGPTPGRRFDAGLFRPLRIEGRPSTFIADWCLRYDLSDDFSSADATVTVELDGTAGTPCELILRERVSGRLVAQTTAAAGQPLRVRIDHPRLWSPEVPFLYTLSITAGEDRVAEEVGFRRLESRGRDLWLNGERLVLKGVCRHEFMSGFGYSPPEAEVRRELAQIRHTGFNHIRLVHSPQAPCVARIAAEIGILVSEEPGTCFHDLADPAVADPAIDALKAMVKRDRNLPSILAWYIYNECMPNTAYAVRAAAACRELNPGCLVAMADCSGKVDEIKAMVAAANLSFYGINTYTYWGPDYQKGMDTYTDRPLVFTEWGGCLAQDNRRIMDWLCRTFARATCPTETRRIAGCSYWAWADYEEYSRGEFAAIDGWTVEGLIDKHRHPKPDLALMSQWCFDVDHPAEIPQAAAEILIQLPQRPGAFTVVDLDRLTGDQTAAEAQMEKSRNPGIVKNYSNGIEPRLARLPSLERVQVAGIPFACRGGREPVHPLLLGAGRNDITIPIGRLVSGVSVLGHVAFHAAYPANGIASVHHADAEPVRAYGDEAGEYHFVFADGTETVILRHGVHILRANEICRWWLTAPRAPETAPAIRATSHPSYEIMRIDLWQTSWSQARHLREIRWRLRDEQSVLALYALTTHDA